MDKNHQAVKFGSFTRINGYKKSDFAISPKNATNSPKLIAFQPDKKPQESHDHNNHDDTEVFTSNVHQLSSETDQFIDHLCNASAPPDVPESVEALSKIVESRIAMYTTSGHKFGMTTTQGEEETFIAAVKQIYKLTNAFTEFTSEDTATSLNRTSSVLQRAMMFIEDAFWNLLEDCKKDCCLISESEEDQIKESEHMEKLKMLAYTMVCSGYETECQQVYTIERRNVFKDELEKLGYEKYNIEHIHKMNWDSLEGEIARWTRVVKHCSSVLFPRERKLVDSVFADYPCISRSLFTNLARTILTQLLDFAEAVAITKSSAEKLFKFLDMYETLRDLVPAISPQSDTNCDSEKELKSETESAEDRISKAAVNSFTDLENSLKNDVAKSPVPGGAVHPLTRYVMNYLRYSCEYSDTLKQIFQKNTKSETEESSANPSPFSQKLVEVMDLLDANLEAKSKLYKDQSLCYIFLMNNGRYILQKVKGTEEIHHVMGDTWCRKRSTVVRHYHKSYQRDTWNRLLQCISLEGLQQANGRVSKTTLKEKFKNFNNMFDEIHKTQTTWIVSDEQLLSELRVSIAAVVTPAYRSFLGRYRHILEGSRSNADKYIKYQPEDIETLIEELFEGHAMSMSMSRKR